MFYTESEQKIINKNTMEIVKYINEEIQPRLRDCCMITFGGGYYGGYTRHIFVTPKRLQGMTGSLYYDFTEEPSKGNVSVFKENGMDLAVDMMKHWTEIKAKLLKKVSEQDTTWLNDFTV